MAPPLTDDFATAERTSDADLDQLLREGDPPQRVWAAWALALRRGSAVRSAIAAEFGRSPDVGARRLLLITLAGLGERTILRELAEHEPDPMLRGEALVLFWRTAVKGDGQALEFMCARLCDEADLDVLARLIEIEPRLPGNLAASRLLAIAQKPVFEVRAAAWRRLIGSRLTAPEWAVCLQEPDPGLRRFILDQWARSDEHAELLRFAFVGPLAKECQSALIAAGRRYSWLMLISRRGQLAPLALHAGDYPEARRLLRRAARARRR